MNYQQIIPYSLPKNPAKRYSDKALEILKEIEELCPEALPIFARSDIAITLSGVRSYNAYVGELTQFLSPKDIEALKSLLQKHDIYLESDESEYPINPGEEPWFYMINEKALKLIPEQYGLDAWIEPIAPYSFDRFMAWQSIIEDKIHYEMVRERLPYKWSQFFWAVSSIWEGMLYGYPAIAITSYNDWDIAMILARSEDEEPGPLLESDVAYRDMYLAPHVVYSYPRELKGDEAIEAHRRLWSEVLIGIYESDWHKKVKKSKEFLERLSAINEHAD